MPIIKSAAKRVKQAEKRHERNLISKRELRENTKALEAAISTGDTKDLDALLAKVYSSYDTSVKKNLVHKNKAARKKSYYSEQVKGVSSSKTKKAPAKKAAPKKTAAKASPKK